MTNSNTTKKNKAGIYVESKPVAKTHSLSKFIAQTPYKNYKNSDHLLFVYRDEAGNEQIIRGGPINDNQFRATFFPNVPIEVEKGISRNQSRDKYSGDTGPETRHSIRLNIPQGKEQEYWENFKKSASKLDNLGIEYKNTTDMKGIQNSNSTIRTILQENCFIPERNIPQEVKNSIPGFETDLLNNPRLTPRVDIDKPDMPRLLDDNEQKSKLEKLKLQDKERELFESFKKNSNPAQDILLKKDQDITENEVKEASRYAMFEAKDPIVKQNLSNKAGNWYSFIYGDAPAKADATGRNIEPQAKTSLASEVKPLVSKDGMDIFEGFKKLASSVSQHENGVAALQKGINELGYQPQLKEDGILGSKTAWGIKDAMANHGVGEIEKKLKLTKSSLI